MTTDAITTALSLGAVVVLVAFTLSDAFTSIVAFFGNALAEKLGLQETRPIGHEYSGRKVKVLSVEGEVVQVELDGSPWRAVPAPPGYRPAAGEWAIVKKVDGLTLEIRRDESVGPERGGGILVVW